MMSTEAAAEKAGPGQGEVNGKAKHEPNTRKERPQKRGGGGGRFEPYGNPARRYRVFVSNIPYDVKWQALKDLMKEKVGEVTYVEHLTDGEGKSRGCAVVEFRTEELMKKAVDKVNKHSMNGRPLKVKEDPEGVIAQRDARRSGGGGGGNGHPGPGGMNMGNMNMGNMNMDRMGMDRMGMDRMNMDRMNMDRMGMDRMGMDRMNMDRMGMDRMGMDRMNMDRMGMDRMDRMGMDRMNMDRMGPGPGAPPINIPPSLLNNPSIPSEIIHGLQAGKIGSTIFVANLDYKVGWKKLKEVFAMAGMVVRTDILEDKDGKSRGMGTVTFDMPIEAVQAVSMFNGQLLFNRVMHVKLDEKSLPRGGDMTEERPPALPRGLSGIGQGLGPGGQPIDATQLNRGGGGGDRERGGGMGGMGPGGMDRPGMDGMGFGGGMGRMGGMDNFQEGGGMNNSDRFGPSGMGRLNEGERGGIGGAFDREFGRTELARNDLGMSRNNFGESFERGMGSTLGMDRMSAGMDRMSSGMDRQGSGMDRLGSGMDRMGPGIDRLGGMERMNRASDLDRLGSGFDRMGSGLDRGPGLDRLGPGLDRLGPSMDRLGPSMDRLGSGLDRMSSSVDRLGPAGFDRLGPSSLDRMSGAGLDFASPMAMDRMNTGLDRMGSNFDRMASAGIDRFPSAGLDRMGSSMERMGAAGVGAQFDRPADLDRGFGGNAFGGAGAGGPGGPGGVNNPRPKGCQIFVRNLPFDFTWKMLKDTFNTCGMVQYADIKMENGKSKGCGVVRFDNPEVAERACRSMNGFRLNGREIDVRIDRNA